MWRTYLAAVVMTTCWSYLGIAEQADIEIGVVDLHLPRRLKRAKQRPSRWRPEARGALHIQAQEGRGRDLRWNI
jgi:hypothetical protein